MEKLETVDLSALEPELARVEICRFGERYRARVKIGRMRYVGSGVDKLSAVAKLLGSGLLRSTLSGRPGRGGRGRGET